MSSGKQRVIQAAQECDEDGHVRDDGKFVDPLAVQKVAIEEGFRQAATDEDFDVWTVVNESTLREGDTVAENFQRVWNQWEDTVESKEVKEAVMERLEEMEQEGE